MPLPASTGYEEPFTPPRRPCTPLASNQAGPYYVGRLRSPFAPVNCIDDEEEPTTPSRRPRVPSPIEFEEDSISDIRSRLRTSLPSIEEDPEEEHYQYSAPIFSSNPGSTLKSPSFMSTQPTLPSPKPIQTVFQHLEEVGKASGVEIAVDSEEKETTRTSLSLKHTKRAELTNCMAAPQSTLARNVLSEIDRELRATQKDLMATLYGESRSSQGKDPLETKENLIDGTSKAVKGKQDKYRYDGGRGKDNKINEGGWDPARYLIDELRGRASVANVVEDLREFFRANQIEDGRWSTGEEDERRSKGASTESHIMEETKQSKEKRQVVAHMRGGAGDEQELSAHPRGVRPDSEAEPHMRGGGPKPLNFVPRKGSHRNPAFVARRRPEPDQQSERSLSPSIKSSNRTSLNESLINAARRQQYKNDGEELMSSRERSSVLESEPGSYVSIDSHASTDSRVSNRFGHRDKLDAFPSPPLRVPQSPIWNPESETEIATPTPFERKNSLLKGGPANFPKLRDVEEQEKELYAKNAPPVRLNTVRRVDERAEDQDSYPNFSPSSTTRPTRSNTVVRGNIGVAISQNANSNSPPPLLVDRGPPKQPGNTQRFRGEDPYINSQSSTPRWPFHPATPVSSTGLQTKYPYPPSLSSLQDHSDSERELRLDNSRPIVPVTSLLQYYPTFQSSLKGEQTDNEDISRSPTDQDNENLRDQPSALSPVLMGRMNSLANKGNGPASLASPETRIVSGKGFDPRMDINANQSSSPKLASHWNTPVRDHGLTRQNTAQDELLSNADHESPPTSDLDPLPHVSAGSVSKGWSKKGYKNYKDKPKVETQGVNLQLRSGLGGAQDELPQYLTSEGNGKATDQTYHDPNQYEDDQDSDVWRGEEYPGLLEGKQRYDRNQAARYAGGPPQAAFERLGITDKTTGAFGSLTPPKPDGLFKSVSEQGGFQGQLAEEGRVLPSVDEHTEIEEVHAMTATARRPKTPDVTPEERQEMLRNYKIRQEKMYQELRQGKLRNDGSDRNAEFEADWKLRAQDLGIEEADIARMIQDAARLLVEQQQSNAPRSALHSLGRRLNKTMKLVLAIPSDPNLKTYSKSRPRTSHKRIALPFGAGPMSAYGLQGRLPTTPSTRSRPPTAASYRTKDKQKQSGELSRRPSAPGSLGSGERFNGEAGARVNSPYIGAQSRPRMKADIHRGSDAMLWDGHQPFDPRSPGYKSGQAHSSFSDAGTQMPTQGQLGNLRYEDGPMGIYAPPKKPSVGSLKAPRHMFVETPRVPSPRYNPSVKSYDTTAIPTQSQVYAYGK